MHGNTEVEEITKLTKFDQDIHTWADVCTQLLIASAHSTTEPFQRA